MRFVLQLSLCCLLAGGVAVAQRGGGGRGMGGGGRMGGGAFVGGGRGGSVGGGRGGFVGGGSGFRSGTGVRPGFGRGFDRDDFFRRGFDRDAFFRGGFGPYVGSYRYLGGSLGYGADYSDYPSAYGPYSYNPYGYGYTTDQPSPNVTVIYPQQPMVAAPERPVRSVIREYDQEGQEVRQNGSPLYLIAFNDHTIRAAASYRVEGNTLHYVTPEREEKQAPLDTIDRALSMQLNRERQVPFQLPPQ